MHGGLKVYRLLLRAATKTITELSVDRGIRCGCKKDHFYCRYTRHNKSTTRCNKSTTATQEQLLRSFSAANLALLLPRKRNQPSTTATQEQLLRYFFLQLTWHYCYHEGATTILQLLPPLLLLFCLWPSLVVHCRYFECNSVVGIIVLFAGDAELQPHHRTRQPLCLSEIRVSCTTDVVAMVGHHIDMFKHYV